MRVDFCKSIYRILDRDPLALLITGDLGFSAFDEFAAAHGKRFLNAGVAEQNMMGMAAGMALTGLRPWVYSIVPFVTYRCLEQIRNDVCFHNLPVRIVGNGGGYTYGILGSTHHALEDLGMLKTLPNIGLFFPCANDQVVPAMEAIDRSRVPTYLRLAVSPFATARKPLSENPQTLTRHYHQGSALTILGIGHAVQIALAALERFGLGNAGRCLWDRPVSVRPRGRRGAGGQRPENRPGPGHRGKLRGRRHGGIPQGRVAWHRHL
jgi:transketolase